MIEEETLKRVLSIDYGIKRIGLALSDPLLAFAYPFKTIPNDNKLWKELLNIIKEKEVEKIILGFPYSEKESLTSVAEKILKFKKELENRSGLEIMLWDETFTSEMAKEIIIKSVIKKSKRKEKGILDKNSAAIMLQEYLDGLKSKNK